MGYNNGVFLSLRGSSPLLFIDKTSHIHYAPTELHLQYQAQNGFHQPSKLRQPAKG
jgi:hypothetical protein